MQLDYMPGALVVPLLVLLECVNSHQLSEIGLHAASGPRQRPCWSHQAEGPGRAGANVAGCQGVEGSLASLLPLVALGLSH